jgi:hypothetical protein
VSPRRAAIAAERALTAARSEHDARAEVAALHALAWAQAELGEPSAFATIRAGIRIAAKCGNRRGEGLSRRRLAFMLTGAGRVRAAERELRRALELFDDLDRARSQVFRVEIHRAARSGDPEADRAVLADAAGALALLRRRRDRIWEARLLFNLGLLLIDRGDLQAAETDLRRAHDLYLALGALDAAADADGHLAWVALQRGDLVGCLATIAALEASLPTGRLAVNVAFIRTAALTEARLLPEARDSAEALARDCAKLGYSTAARTVLRLAGLSLMAGDPVAARRLAGSVERTFAAHGQTVNAALARLVALRARLSQGAVDRGAARSALDVVAVFDRAGWRLDALRARMVAARIALAVKDLATARRQLAPAAGLASLGTVSDRIELLHSRALVQLAEGDPGRAQRLLASGLRLLDEHRAELGAEDLRASASSIGAELGATGIGVALASGRAGSVLAWAERTRANALRLPPVSPPADARLRALQSELRRVVELGRAERAAGRPARALASRRSGLESAIRSHVRLAAAGGSAHPLLTDRRAAARALGDRVLVEYVEHGESLWALTLANGRLKLHALGEKAPADELELLRYGLGRLARRASSTTEQDRAGVVASAAVLDRLLVEPLLPIAGDAGIVVVPTGALHALPWGALPSLRGRAVVVTPSLASWLGLAELPRSRRRRIALVAGPHLRHADAEVRSLARLHPGSTILSGKTATAKASLAALDGAAIAHVACHGSFRADSPLFSALELADGPLNVYELQRLKRAPEVVVLSACDLGRSGVHPGDELLGLTAALLGMGTRTIVASVVPVSDSGAKALMVELHRRLVAGTDVASALAAAQEPRPDAGFVCVGA